MRCHDSHKERYFTRIPVYLERKIAKRRENSRGEVSESFTDLSRMISSARPCGVGETPHLDGEAGPRVQRQNCRHERNYFGGNWKSI